MDWTTVHTILANIQHIVSTIGILIIIAGVILALLKFVYYLVRQDLLGKHGKINMIRLDLGKVLILGLEFIVAADLINTTTTPDYYTVGLLAIIVAIRTFLSYSLNREMMKIAKE